MSEKLWQDLEIESHDKSSHGVLIRRIHPQSHCNLFLGFEKPGDRRMFLLRIDRSYLPRVESLPVARGIEVLSRVLPYDGEDKVSLGIILKEPRFKDIFTALVDDLAGKVALVGNDEQAVATFVSRLQRWQKFLEASTEGLSEEEQKGLYGELYFLFNYILPKLGPQGVFSWTGSRRTAQDFQFSRCAIEVKTSSAKQLQELRISSELQLDGTNLDALFLYHLSLEQSQGSGQTLKAIVQSLRNRLASDPIANEAFEEALLDAGYLDIHDSHYVVNSFNLRASNFFKVIEGFPCIIERDLPKGVGDVHYSISVAECMHFAVCESEVTDLMRVNIND